MEGWFQIGLQRLQAPDALLILLDGGLKSLVVLAFAGAWCLCWRRASAAARHWVWFLAVASLFWLPWLSLTVPGWPGPRWAVSADLESGNRVTLAMELAPNPRSPLSLPAAQTPITATRSRADAASGRVARIAAQLDARWLLTGPALWFIGMALVLAYVAVGRLQLRRICRRARPAQSSAWEALLQELRRELDIRRPVRLVQSPDRVIPMTWGWLRPTILLPADADRWPVERQRIVLWHELAHVKRRDCLTQMIAVLACALYWFNPLVWLAARRLCVERERACDDVVLNGGCAASDYSNHLVEIARASRSVPQVEAIAMARPSGLEQRVRAILDGHRNRGRVARLAAVLIALVVAGFGLLLGGCVIRKQPPVESWYIERSTVGDQLKRFVVEKEVQAIAGAEAEGREMLPEYRSMFAAAAKGDWLSISNIWEDLRRRAPQYEGSGPKDMRLHGTAWQTMLEIWGAFGNIAMGGERLVALGRDAVDSIPPASIYFGGTDPGRCVITALQESHVQGKPFFTLTQNALADASYLGYLRRMYGASVYIPTDEDSKQCFSEYVADAQRRLKENKLKPGEDVSEVDGRMQVSGQVAVMAINALLAKIIFDRNPEFEFYLEESFPLDWMYPHLSPHGPIMRIHRQPLSELSDEIVRRDHEYWTGAVRPMIGDWLDYETSLQRIAAFAEEAYPNPPKESPYVTNDAARKWGSKLRSSIAGVYAWRIAKASSPAEKQRMIREADFAFRQAFALCPYSPEAVFRYVNLLIEQQRSEDAVLVAATARKIAPENRQFRDLVMQTERVKTSRQK